MTKKFTKTYSEWMSRYVKMDDDYSFKIGVLIRAARICFGITEKWMAIHGYNGLYDVSSFGRVRSLDREVLKSNGVTCKFNATCLSIRTFGFGYPTISLCKNGIPNTCTVHKLVANAFVHNEHEKTHVNHIDSNPMNNYFKNLEHCTHSENMIHAYKYGNSKAPMGKDSVRSIPVVQLHKDGAFIEDFECAYDAHRKTGCRANKVNMCCRGRRLTTGGFRWMYADEYYKDK